MRDLFERTKCPWWEATFDGWSIVGMNHYFIGGQRRLYVAMTKGDRCIKSEGVDTPEIWLTLALAAKAMDEAVREDGHVQA